jgi:hypothetical protein
MFVCQLVTPDDWALQDQVVEVIVEDPSFGIWDFLANVGGVIGLYGGMSLLTILEMCNTRDYESA